MSQCHCVTFLKDFYSSVFFISFHLFFSSMNTTIEHLSNELWTELFRYLRIEEQCRAFSNLNFRLNELIFSHHFQLSFNGDSDHLDYLLKKFLPELKCRDRIKTLRLENLKMVDFDLFEFPNLTTLILHRLKLTKELLDSLERTTISLRFVKISSLISGNKLLLNDLRHLILTRPKLQFCSMRLGVALCPIPMKFSANNSIEHLRLFSNFESCSFDRLFRFLKFLPQLKTLFIDATEIQWEGPLPLDSIDFQCPMTKFTLIVKRLTLSLDSWLEHLSRLTNCLESIEIRSGQPIEEYSYLNLAFWTKFITSSTHLKQIRLEISRGTQLSAANWKRSSNALMRLGRSQNASFSIFPQPE